MLGELEPAAATGQVPDDVRAQDAAGLGRGFQPLGLDDGQPEAVVAFERDVTDADPDPDLDRLGLAAPVVQVDRLLDRDRGTHGVDGRRERRHHPVTRVFDHDAAIGLDRRVHEGVVGLPQPIGRFLADPGALGRGTDHVGEEHRGGVDASLCP